MRFPAAVAALLLGAAACSPPVEILREYRTFTLMYMWPPKHFRVALLDDQSGVLIRKISVSKHCNRWRELELGSKFILPVLTYRRSDGTIYQRIITSGGRICPSS